MENQYTGLDMKLVEELDFEFDFDKFKKECPNIKSDVFGFRMSGLSVQHRKNTPLPWSNVDGLDSLSHYGKNCNDEDFNVVHENFVNTEYEKIINNFNLVRSRIMFLNGKNCYSIHQDNTWRLHIPIKTNLDCLFYFPDYKEHFHLEEGKIYKVNTLEKHTFINAGWDNRIHFIGVIYE